VHGRRGRDPDSRPRPPGPSAPPGPVRSQHQAGPEQQAHPMAPCPRTWLRDVIAATPAHRRAVRRTLRGLPGPAVKPVVNRTGMASELMPPLHDTGRPARPGSADLPHDRFTQARVRFPREGLSPKNIPAERTDPLADPVNAASTRQTGDRKGDANRSAHSAGSPSKAS
jgi:hypothetical protein